MPLSRQKIILTPSNKALATLINPDAEHVHILLDSTTAGFTVTLPDATGSMQRELIFKNIGDYDVTIVPITGQYIDKSLTHTLHPLDLISLWSDLVKTWWMLDNNSISLHTINGPCTDLASAVALLNQVRAAII